MPMPSADRPSQWPVWLCWLAMVLDGFDLVVLGTVIPTLIKTQELGFDAVGATFAATISLVGVGLGALFIAPLSDRFGRRRLLVACVAWFSLFTSPWCSRPTWPVFSIFRLLAGVGLGACLPAALAYMNDYAPAGTAGKSTTRTMTGYHVGAVATAFLALLVMPNWRHHVRGRRRGRARPGAVPVVPAAGDPARGRSLPVPPGRPRTASRRAAEERASFRDLAEALPAGGPGHRRGVLHGAPAGLRPEHLAAAAHGLRRVHRQHRPGAAAGAQRGRRGRA